MSTETETDGAAELRTAVTAAIEEAYPELQTGGGRPVREVDPTTGVVTLSFGCGCSGGVSEATEAAVANHIVDVVDGIDAVRTASGCGCGGGHRGGSVAEVERPGPSTDEGPDAPF
ncbi:MAG: hypothetical protein ABEJ35_07215 [Halobacteriaceae archaeon]